jgi:L-ascorbate 6-phosphate lactonase
MKTHQSLIDDINSCQVKHGQCALWWLGQHSFVAKLGAAILYIDPFLTHLDGRQIPPLAHASDVTNANIILGSHDHPDHIDRPAWPHLAKASPHATFVVPKLLREQIVKELNLPDNRVVGVDDGISINLHGVKITGVPAAHEFLDRQEKTGLHPFIGFVIEANGFCLYHAGDTCIYEGMQTILRKWKFDLALLPINGRDAKRFAANIIGNMTYQEAADLAGALKPGLTIPTHFEMFAANSENPQLFIDYMHVKYPKLNAIIPQHSHRLTINAHAR